MFFMVLRKTFSYVELTDGFFVTEAECVYCAVRTECLTVLSNSGYCLL